MKEIPLTRGKVAIVDDEDYERLSRHKWYEKRGYAVRNVYPGGGEHRCEYMHRVVIGEPIAGMHIDHINRNGLDNRKTNLRFITKRQNCINSGLQRNNTSGRKGVTWHKLAKKWMAYIKSNGKQITLGFYMDKEEASRAYDEAAKKYHGEFAVLNSQISSLT